MRTPDKIGRSRVWLYLVALICAAGLMWMLRICSHPGISGNEPRLSSPDTLDVAIEYSPLSLYTFEDTLGGLNHDIIRAMARRNGLNVKFHPITSLTQALDGLNDSVYDMVVADLPMTVELQQRFRQTVPIILDRQVLVQRKDSTGSASVRSQLDLAGKRVRVVAKSPAAFRLRNLADEIGDTIIIDEDSVYGSEQIFLMVASGEIPYAVVNANTAAKLVSDYPDVDVSKDVSFTQFQSWLLRKSDRLQADSIDSMIIRFKHTPEFNILVNRYINN